MKYFSSDSQGLTGTRRETTYRLGLRETIRYTDIITCKSGAIYYVSLLLKITLDVYVILNSVDILPQ